MDTATLGAAEELNARVLALVTEAGGIAEKADADGRDFTDEERSAVKAKLDEAKKLKDQAIAAQKAHDDDVGLKSELADIARMVGTDAPNPAAPADPKGRGKSIGERVTSDERFADWLKNMGQSSKVRAGDSPAVGFAGLKDIFAGTDDDRGGALVTPDWRGLVDSGAYARPLTLRQLVTGGTTGSDTVEFARELTATSNAATVAEATGTSAGTASDDVAGTKPESDYTLEKVTETVKTIAHWIPATKRALSDAAQTRTLIDTFLRYGLEEELEDQIATGDGTGENFDGILSTDGTQDQAWDTDLLVTTRKARTKVRTVGRATPTAYVFNPADNERIDLERDDNGNFYFGGPAGMGVQTLWGLPRVESEAIPEGQGVVADWRRAILWDREQAGISVSDSHADFFVRNLIAILAELRAAFGVVRPSAFVIIDLTAGS